jgi:hypothetical protein
MAPEHVRQKDRSNTHTSSNAKKVPAHPRQSHPQPVSKLKNFRLLSITTAQLLVLLTKFSLKNQSSIGVHLRSSAATSRSVAAPPPQVFVAHLHFLKKPLNKQSLPCFPP